MNKILIGILVFVGVCVFWLMGSYNGLVGMNEGVNGKWAQVENQLQRRFDSQFGGVGEGLCGS